MDDQDRAIILDGFGLSTNGIGPHAEWSPAPRAVFQLRHNAFWGLVSGIITSEPEDYDDLPDYLTEIASEQLEANE